MNKRERQKLITKAHKALDAFLKEGRESKGGDWAAFTTNDELDLYVLMDAIAKAKFEEDSDGDRPLSYKMVNRTHQQPLYYTPLPYLYKAKTLLDIQKYMRLASMNLNIATEDMRALNATFEDFSREPGY